MNYIKGALSLKKIAFSLLILVLCLGAASAAGAENGQTQTYPSWLDLLINKEPFEEYGSFTCLPSYSFDGKYRAEISTEKLENDDVTMAYIVITDTASEEIIDIIRTRRAFDFWGICWDEYSYDIFVQSADTGEYTLKYTNGEWLEDTKSKLPDYIITRDDISSMRYLVKNLVGKELSAFDDVYPDRYDAYAVGIIKCGVGYIAYTTDENEKITAAAGFGFRGRLLYNKGLSLIDTSERESLEFTTSDELTAALGTDYSIFHTFPPTMAYVTNDGQLLIYTQWGSGKNEELVCEAYSFNEIWEKKSCVEAFDYHEYEDYIEHRKRDITLEPVKDYNDAIIQATRTLTEKCGLDMAKSYQPYSAYYNSEYDIWLIKSYQPKFTPRHGLFGGDSYFFIEGETGRVLAYWFGK